MKRFVSSVSRAALAFALVPLSAHAVFAQADTVRTLSGTVTNSDKQPVAGAVVKVENVATKAILSYITDAHGVYTVKRLSGNTDYTVWAAWKGQLSKQKSLDHFSTATEATIDLSIDAH